MRESNAPPSSASPHVAKNRHETRAASLVTPSKWLKSLAAHTAYGYDLSALLGVMCNTVGTISYSRWSLSSLMFTVRSARCHRDRDGMIQSPVCECRCVV
mmetsp:Transcript_30631/g.93727  ORF Transcript_30631/g.93727 Transcript_30631/m.93727 type:complete len:100 (-) Transcript_30631:183-482(-)